jgi:predicted aspartyl protease
MFSDIRRKRFLSFWGCLAICLTSVAAIGDESNLEKSSVERERFPIRPGDGIQIPVEIFGEKHTFILDTGASFCVLDSEFSDRLKFVTHKTIKAMDKARTVSVYHGTGMTIGDRFPQAHAARFVVCTDFSLIRSATGYKEAGILGMDFMGSRVVRINYDEGYASFQQEVTPLPSHVEKFQSDKGPPFIPLRVSDTGARSFLIDTGSTGDVRLEYQLFQNCWQRFKMAARGNRRGG